MIRVAPHRATSKGRRNDTGANVWMTIICRAIEHCNDIGIGPVVVDYDYVKGDGRPVPKSWDIGARFDEKGRKL